MKNALLVYPRNSQGIFNIGDYIQSIAARQFLPSVDLYLNREELNKHLVEKVKLIMNGWYMHNPQNWPPTEDIEPLFAAFHMNKLAEKEMLSARGIDYLKRHEPIGCRDRYTVNLLKSKGIDAYFSGCMTLTLGKTYNHKNIEDGKIYFTDLDSTLKHDFAFKLKCLYVITIKRSLMKRIQHRMESFGVKKALRTVTAFYVTFSSVFDDNLFTEAVYKAHEILDTFESDDAKFEYANKLLQEYSKAKFVVSSRIHCALPCLGMGTPVAFVTNSMIGEINNCRLDGLKQLFHTIDISENGIVCNIPGLSKLDRTSIFNNKSDYKILAKNLTKTCTVFFS